MGCTRIARSRIQNDERQDGEGVVGRRSRVEEKGLCYGGYAAATAHPRRRPLFPPLFRPCLAVPPSLFTATDNYALIVYPLPPPPLFFLLLLFPFSLGIYIYIYINSLVSSPARFSRFYVPSRRFRTSVTHNGTSGVNFCFFVVALVARNRRRSPPLGPTTSSADPPFFFASIRPLPLPLSSPLLSFLRGGSVCSFVYARYSGSVNATAGFCTAGRIHPPTHPSTGENSEVRVRMTGLLFFFTRLGLFLVGARFFFFQRLL